MQAGVVREQSVVTQRHVLLLPLLVEGFTASLQQHALQHIIVNNINHLKNYHRFAVHGDSSMEA